MGYKESIHTRLSEDQKSTLINLAGQHQLSVSTALRGMIDYCLSTPGVMESISDTTKEKEEDVTDGIV